MKTNAYEPESTYTDHDWDVFSKWIKGVLISTTPTITFTKKDGTERVMRCTLRDEFLPTQEINENKTPRKYSDKVMSVYDIDAQGWRSFTINAVKRVEFELNDD